MFGTDSLFIAEQLGEEPRLLDELRHDVLQHGGQVDGGELAHARERGPLLLAADAVDASYSRVLLFQFDSKSFFQTDFSRSKSIYAGTEVRLSDNYVNLK